MTSGFSWLNSNQPLPCFILYSKAKFASYARCFLTAYFCIPVPYKEKDIFFGCQFQKVLQSSQNCSSSASSALLVGAQTWLTVILNGLPWKRTEVILSFLRLHPSTLQTVRKIPGDSLEPWAWKTDEFGLNLSVVIKLSRQANKLISLSFLPL